MKKTFKVTMKNEIEPAKPVKGTVGKGGKQENSQIPESIFTREYAEYNASKEKENA